MRTFAPKEWHDHSPESDWPPMFVRKSHNRSSAILTVKHKIVRAMVIAYRAALRLFDFPTLGTDHLQGGGRQHDTSK